MGQYYKAIILGPSGKKEFIRLWLSPSTFRNGQKLMEHCWMGNPFVQAVENLLSPDSMFYKSRIVWAGDYADKEVECNENLHKMALGDDEEEDDTSSCDPSLGRWCAFKPQHVASRSTSAFPFIVNHDKKLYVEKKGRINPLPILTAEGNGRGGGDYRGSNETLCGTWARDTISVEKTPPTDYQDLNVTFGES